MTIQRSWNVRGVVKCTLVLTGLFAISLATDSTVSAQSGTFSITASLNTARYNHTATLLQNGQVLVTGGLGANSNASLASAEVYNPAKKGTWTVTGSMSVGRDHFTAADFRHNIVSPARLDFVRANDTCIQCHAQFRPLANPIRGVYYDWAVGYQPGDRLADYVRLEEGRLGQTSFYYWPEGSAHKNREQGNDFVTSVMLSFAKTP